MSASSSRRCLLDRIPLTTSSNGERRRVCLHEQPLCGRGFMWYGGRVCWLPAWPRASVSNLSFNGVSSVSVSLPPPHTHTHSPTRPTSTHQPPSCVAHGCLVGAGCPAKPSKRCTRRVTGRASSFTFFYRMPFSPGSVHASSPTPSPPPPCLPHHRWTLDGRATAW